MTTLASAATKDAGHANAYAQALVTGLWPNLDVLPQRERAARGRALPESAMRLAIRAFEGERVKTTNGVSRHNETPILPDVDNAGTSTRIARRS